MTKNQAYAAWLKQKGKLPKRPEVEHHFQAPTDYHGASFDKSDHDLDLKANFTAKGKSGAPGDDEIFVKAIRRRRQR